MVGGRSAVPDAQWRAAVRYLECNADYKKESVDKVAQRCENYSYRKGAKNEESATPKVE